MPTYEVVYYDISILIIPVRVRFFKVGFWFILYKGLFLLTLFITHFNIKNMQSIVYVRRFLHKHYLLFILCFFMVSITIPGHAQEDINPLTIGDKVPDIEFDNVINYPTKTARLSDFKSKLTILDFWSSSCTACIDYFPHMQSVQDKFKNDLRIILVNSKSAEWHDNEPKINWVLRNVQARSRVAIRLPVIFKCTQLDTYFPFSTIPQEVWLNDQGRVIAITGPEEVTPANIKAILEGKKVNLHQKYYLPFDITTHPLAELVYGAHSSLFNRPLSSSLLIKGYINGLGSILGVRHADSPFAKFYTGWSAINMPLLAIYKSAYRDKVRFPANQILVETRDSALFRRIEYNDSAYASYYSYDINVPPAPMEKLLDYVQHDLERTFHTTVVNERRRIPCFVVTATPESKESYTKGGKMEYRMDRIDTQKWVRNFPMADLIRSLNATYFDIPLINATRLTQNVDIDMPQVLTQQNIIRSLEKAGFGVKKELKDMKVAL